MCVSDCIYVCVYERMWLESIEVGKHMYVCVCGGGMGVMYAVAWG